MLPTMNDKNHTATAPVHRMPVHPQWLVPLQGFQDEADTGLQASAEFLGKLLVILNTMVKTQTAWNPNQFAPLDFNHGSEQS